MQKFHKSRSSLNAALQKSYGVTLDTPDAEVGARGKVAARLCPIYTKHDAKKLPQIAKLVPLNPEPQTLNSKPKTLNHKPQTLNPIPQTPNPKSSTLNQVDQHWGKLGALQDKIRTKYGEQCHILEDGPPSAEQQSTAPADRQTAAPSCTEDAAPSAEQHPMLEASDGAPGRGGSPPPPEDLPRPAEDAQGTPTQRTGEML